MERKSGNPPSTSLPDLVGATKSNRTDIFFGEHPNQKQQAISTRWFFGGESKRQSEISQNIQTKNNERFQRDEFIAGKAIETSKPKTTTDFTAMNLSRGKQTTITRNIQKSNTTSEFNSRQSSPRLKLEWIEWINNEWIIKQQTTKNACNMLYIMQRGKNKEMRSEHSYVSNTVNLRSGQMLHIHTHTAKGSELFGWRKDPGSVRSAQGLVPRCRPPAHEAISGGSQHDP